MADFGNGSTPSCEKPEYWTDGRIPWLNCSLVDQDEVTEAETIGPLKERRAALIAAAVTGNLAVGHPGTV